MLAVVACLDVMSVYFLVGDYLDRFRRVDGTWLLERRTLVLAFGGPTARARRDR